MINFKMVLSVNCVPVVSTLDKSSLDIYICECVEYSCPVRVFLDENCLSMEPYDPVRRVVFSPHQEESNVCRKQVRIQDLVKGGLSL